MDEVCSGCLFCEAVEDEDYMACQFRQMLVMPWDKACDYFEAKGCVCKECTGGKPVMYDINDTNTHLNQLQDEYTNTTELPKVKIVEQEEDDIIEYASMEGLREAIRECECDYCNANSYPEAEEDIDPMIEAMMEDLDEAATEVLENLAFLGDGKYPDDVFGPILGLEATIACLKRFLFEYKG